MTIEPTRMLTGPGVLRVVWLPGSDQLQGTCHCGARHNLTGHRSTRYGPLVVVG